MWGGLRGRFFGPGELRLALLSLLEQGPKHGYELMKQLEARSGGLYRASAGSVYPTLQQLEDEGLATSQSLEGKRIYRLTDAGRELVEDEAGAIRRIWRRADEWGDWSHAAAPEAWEVARPAMELAKAALRAVASEDADGERVDQVRRILVKARREIERLDAEEEEADAGDRD
jgi:DNA-binding PadR family transcriptional regulator